MSAILAGVLIARCLSTIPADPTSASSQDRTVEVLVAKNGQGFELLLLGAPGENAAIPFPKASVSGTFSFTWAPSMADLSAQTASGLHLQLSAPYQKMWKGFHGTLSLRGDGPDLELGTQCFPLSSN